VVKFFFTPRPLYFLNLCTGPWENSLSSSSLFSHCSVAAAVTCAVPLPSSSSYLCPQTSASIPSFTLLLSPSSSFPSFFCFFEQNHPLPWPPPPLFTVGSHHQPLPALLDPPCRASPLPTGAPRLHPGANPSPDRPTDVHRRPSSAAASASPSTRPSSSSHPSPITLVGLHHLEEAPGPPHRASLTPSMPEHRRRDQARPSPAFLQPLRLQPSQSKASSCVPQAPPPLPRRREAPHRRNRAH
jgi:hypothetical protein